MLPPLPVRVAGLDRGGGRRRHSRAGTPAAVHNRRRDSGVHLLDTRSGPRPPLVASVVDVSSSQTPRDDPGRTHPVLAFAAGLATALDTVADAAAWSMTEVEQRTALVRLTRCAHRLAELRLRVLAAADRTDVGKADGSASTAAWLAGATRQPHALVRADLQPWG